MKRRGSWQINFIVRALTGMGSIFLVNQWMDYRNIPVSVGLNVLSFWCPDVLEFRELPCFMDYVLSVYVGVAQTFFLV